MAGYVPLTHRALMLENLVGRTAIGATSVYLGLASSVGGDPLAATMTSLTEIATAGYARIQIPAFGAATVADKSAKITTPTDFQFAPVTAAMSVAALYGFITTTATGTSGQLRYIFEIVDPIKVLAGEPIIVPANTLIVE